MSRAVLAGTDSADRAASSAQVRTYLIRPRPRRAVTVRFELCSVITGADKAEIRDTRLRHCLAPPMPRDVNHFERPQKLIRGSLAPRLA